MASLPGFPGTLGLSQYQSGNPSNSDASFAPPAPPPPAPVIVNRTLLSDDGSIPATTEGNTLVVLSNYPYRVPYIHSTGTAIGTDTWGDLVFDGMAFYDAIIGPLNVDDSSASAFPPFFTGDWGWYDCGIWYLESVPGGVTGIRFLDPNVVPPVGFLVDWPAYFLVYELSPSVFDVSSINMAVSQPSPLGGPVTNISAAQITPTAGSSDILFGMEGKIDYEGCSVSVNFPADEVLAYTDLMGDITPTLTIYFCHLSDASGPTEFIGTLLAMGDGTSHTGEPWGGALAAFKGVSG